MVQSSAVSVEPKYDEDVSRAYCETRLGSCANYMHLRTGICNGLRKVYRPGNELRT